VCAQFGSGAIEEAGKHVERRRSLCCPVLMTANRTQLGDLSVRAQLAFRLERPTPGTRFAISVGQVDYHEMKLPFLAVLFSATLLVLPFGVAQTPSSTEEEKLLALVKQVQIQQAQITDNQAKIESELADLAETIRIARLYGARAR